MLRKMSSTVPVALFLLLLAAAPALPSFHHRYMNAKLRQSRSVGGLGEEGGGEEICSREVVCDRDAIWRTIDGTCNNLENPLWGASFRAFTRYLPPRYEDGVSVPRGDGRNLPNARLVSATISNVPELPINRDVSLMTMQWGQFLDHDLVFTPEDDELECCDDFQTTNNSNPDCRPILVKNDEFFKQFGVKCLRFVRSVPSKCVTGRREQINTLTGYIDASQVYGSTDKEMRQLRTFTDGLLLIGPEAEREDPDSCPTPLNSNCRYEFLKTVHLRGEDVLLGGEIRVEEQPSLTAIHTIFTRLHNFIAGEIKALRRVRTDEDIFQLTRKIIGAIAQVITYKEFLPTALGLPYMNEFNLETPSTTGTFNFIYTPAIDVTAPSIFATAAFRWGHTLINNTFILPNTAVDLRQSFFQHNVTLRENSYPSDFVRGVTSARAQRYDHFMVRALTNFLYADPPFRHGSDLLARNIARGRDHGIPPYVEWREFCGFGRINNFGDLQGIMESNVIAAFRSIYERVGDIDVFPALIAENSAPGGGLIGPTLQCLLGRHFASTKFGDRFWFESKGQPLPFTNEQIQALYNTGLSTVFCYTANVASMQRFALRVPSTDSSNPLIPCTELVQDSILGRLRELFAMYPAERP